MKTAALTIESVLDPVTKYTGFKPGVLPRSISGSLAGTAISTLLGAGLGRYAATPIMKRLFPEYDEDQLQRALTMAGGMAGFAPGAYLMAKTYQLAGPKGLVGGLSNLPSEEPAVNLRQPAVKTSAWSGVSYAQPVSPAWTQPSIPLGTTASTLAEAVSSGTMSPYGAARVAQIMEEAKPQGHGLVAPSAIARAAVSYGVGNLAGRALGAVANSVFGSFSAGEQQNLARGAGIGNLVFDIMGRLAQS